MFCDEFINCGGNQAEAARRAGYSNSTALKLASQWIGDSRQASKKPLMWDYVKAKREELENEFNVSRGRILKGLFNIADFDITEIFDDLGELKQISELSTTARRVIAGLEVRELIGPKGEVLSTKITKIKLHNRVESWAHINKMLGYNAPETVKHDATDSFLDLLKRTSAG